jgi:hypothetical protein
MNEIYLRNDLLVERESLDDGRRRQENKKESV